MEEKNLFSKSSLKILTLNSCTGTIIVLNDPVQNTTWAVVTLPSSSRGKETCLDNIRTSINFLHGLSPIIIFLPKNISKILVFSDSLLANISSHSMLLAPTKIYFLNFHRKTVLFLSQNPHITGNLARIPNLPRNLA